MNRLPALFKSIGVFVVIGFVAGAAGAVIRSSTGVDVVPSFAQWIFVVVVYLISSTIDEAI